MLLFFCAMFIMVEGAVELGLIDRIAQLLQLIIDTAPASARKVSAYAQACMDSMISAVAVPHHNIILGGHVLYATCHLGPSSAS